MRERESKRLHRFVKVFFQFLLLGIVFLGFNPFPVNAGTFYSNNFDLEATGTLPAGWANIGTATWQVGTTKPVSGAKDLEDPTFHVGGIAIYTSAAAVTDSSAQVSQIVQLDGSNHGANTGIFLRISSDGNNGYLFAPDFSPTATPAERFVIFKKVNGTYTTLNQTSMGITWSNGDTAIIKAEVSGATLRWKVWKSTSQEPGTWTKSMTDSSVSTTGYVGLYQGQNGGGNGVSTSVIDDLYWGDVGSSYGVLAAGTISLTSKTSTTVNLSSTAAGGGSSPYTYQWYRDTSSGFTPGAGNILNGKTSLTLSDSGLTASTTYYYKLRATDSLSATADSSEYSVTTSGIATSFTFTGPSSGSLNVASSNFTLTPNGEYTGTLTPLTSGIGTFSPSSLTWSAASDAKTFTYTPTVGNFPHTLSVTADPTFTNSSGTISYAVTQTVTIDNPAIAAGRSPYNWFVSGSSYMSAVNPGAYFKVKFSGTSIALNVDVSAMAAVAAKKYPRITYQVDSGAWQTYQFTSVDTQIFLGSSLSNTTHSLEVIFLSSDAYTARWNGTMGLKITGIAIDSGGSLSTASLEPKRLIAFGDSITEGAWVLGDHSDLTNYSNYEQSTSSYIAGVAADLSAEYGNVAFGGQSWESIWNIDVPAFINAWSYYYGTNSRLTNGLLSPTPDYVFINMGTNGSGPSSGTVVSNWLTSIRTAAGSASEIYVIIPFNGAGRTNITSGLNIYKSSSGDTNVSLIDLGSNGTIYTSSPTYSYDGSHPNVAGDAALRTLITAAADTTAPIISSVTSSSTSTGSTITWNTDEDGSSKVDYGLTSSFGSTTAETDTSPRVTTHPVTLSSLVSCTTYHYRVRSKDAAGNERLDSDNTFTTAGCTVSSSVSSQATSQITAAAGGSLDLLSESKGIALAVPASFAGSDANFQIKQLDKTATIATTSTPTGYSIIGSYIYDLKALSDVSTSISTFDNPITVAMTYGASDISGINESSLKIYRWDGSSWNQLSSCSINTSTKIVSCTTTAFSVFGLFGQANTSSSFSSSSSSSSSTSAPSCGDQAPGAKAPWLYGAIAQDSGSVLLYFTKADNPVNKYVLEYGTKPGDYRYGVQDMGINTRGQMTFLVKSLSPNTTYYFRVRGGNGCATGSWSNEISAKTKGLASFNQLEIIESKLEAKPVEETPKVGICKTYTVKSGDSLWSIAREELGGGNKYKEIIEQNKDKYSSLENSNSLDKGWVLKVNCGKDNNQNVQSPASAETTKGEGYDVKVKVVDTNKKPIEGATVTLHSNPQTTKTDKNGIASFKNVEKGDHKVLIAYNNFEGEQAINLTGDVKEFNLNVTVRQKAVSLSPLAYGIIGIMGLVIIGLIVLLIKGKRRK